MTGWLFQSLWSIILLVIVIVFQPEIREFLGRLYGPISIAQALGVELHVLEVRTPNDFDSAFAAATNGVLASRDGGHPQPNHGVQLTVYRSAALPLPAAADAGR